MNTMQLIMKGLRSPRDVPNYLSTSFHSRLRRVRLEAYRRRKSINRQKPLIHDFIDNDEFVLVILDACRYDIFSEIYQDYVTGELDQVWASGRWTAQYCRRTWRGQYDLTYINSIPVFSDFYFELRNMDFRPSDHITDIVHVWEHEWDPSIGTTPPEEITDETLRHANAERSTRLVAHYAQPHVPYIGDKTLDAWSFDETTADGEPALRDLLTRDSKRPTQAILEQIQSGKVNIENLRDAYRCNVNHVMREVVRLVERVNCPVVITADHGENLGENGYYLHEEDSVLVRQVPWLVLNKSEIGTKVNTMEFENAQMSREYTGSESRIKEHLTALGYK